jgi:hypothetical protein
LVQAEDAEFRENQLATPQFKQEVVTEPSRPNIPKQPATKPAPVKEVDEPRNPITTLIPPWQKAAPMDVPAPEKPAEEVRRSKRLLRVHIISADAQPGQSIVIEATRDMYFADVLDIICGKRQLDKANHVLKLSGTNTILFLDRMIDTIGSLADLDLDRRRFATDGPLLEGAIGSFSSTVTAFHDSNPHRPKGKRLPTFGSHPLAREATRPEIAESFNLYKKYVVWRKQPMRFVAMNERVLGFDSDHIQILPSGTGKYMFERDAGKVTTVHFKNVIGCKVSRRHPTNFKVSPHDAICS